MAVSIVDRHAWKILWLLSAFVLSGCASVGRFRGLAIGDDSLYVAGLPPIHQDKNYSCGAACVAALAAYWNVSESQFRAKCPRMPENTSGHDLQQLAADLGLGGFVYRGSMEDLTDNLRKGRPLIVMIPQPVVPEGGLTTACLINGWNQWGKKPSHWVVVLGLTKSKAVIIHDPESGSMVIAQSAFEKWWAQKGYLTVLISGLR